MDHEEQWILPLSLHIYREREGEFPAHAEKEVSKNEVITGNQWPIVGLQESFCDAEAMTC